MKRKFTFIFLLLIYSSAYSSILGPRSYEDCILENMKNVSNSEVVNQITAACKAKFPNKSSQTANAKGIKECRLYWDGWKLIKGTTPNKEFRTIVLSLGGVSTLHLALHNKMIEELEIEKIKLNSDVSGRFSDFISQNMSTINSYCAN